MGPTARKVLCISRKPYCASLMKLAHAPTQVRATHGAQEGTWYYEVTVARLGATGHARLGWATRKAELQAPVRPPCL